MNGPDQQLFKIPLKYIQSEVTPDQKIIGCKFSLAAKDINILHRNYEKFSTISVICPINSDYIIGYDKLESSLNLINYTTNSRPQKLLHNAVSHTRIVPPNNIICDCRGLQYNKIGDTITGVSQNKSLIYLLYNFLGSVDLFEYYFDTTLKIREV